ncbi:hypothetical protein L917_01239 [Phytophthora nicotianae]|uniref:Uncharacterized protein n=1 Tax=Phytophthora nicotianae TaxID=4792 RepID=W2LXN2_PHYNI|nr:hypothetical protein L917_01239 [Phytophthora nicotianae]
MSTSTPTPSALPTRKPSKIQVSNANERSGANKNLTPPRPPRPVRDH